VRACVAWVCDHRLQTVGTPITPEDGAADSTNMAFYSLLQHFGHRFSFEMNVLTTHGPLIRLWAESTRVPPSWPTKGNRVTAGAAIASGASFLCQRASPQMLEGEL
jgi:hypothetical protein